MFTFYKTNYASSQLFLSSFLKETGGVNDDFWEAHILEGQPYAIRYQQEEIGLLCLHNMENLTLFYIRPGLIPLAQPAFAAALDQLCPRFAYVPTNAELFLSLCVDHHIHIEKQAYFFLAGEGAKVRPAEFPRSLLRPAAAKDEAVILDTYQVAENIRLGKYYILEQNGHFGGQGFLNPLQLHPGAAAIGMSVHPDHRRKGVGRSIILHLADLCRERGLTPVCGCWYYNHNSKRTLESAGFATRTRLLKAWFVQPPEEDLQNGGE